MIFPEMCCRNTTRRVTLRALVEHQTRLWRRARQDQGTFRPRGQERPVEHVKIDRIVENLDPVIRYAVADQPVPAAFVHRDLTADCAGGGQRRFRRH
jgi:hypothetical protein